MSEDLQRVNILGRTFQRISIDEKIYLAPVANDDQEEDRLTAQHDMLSTVFGGALISPRIPLTTNPRRVLDCGYGGGDWCVQFAEEYEDCEVSIPWGHALRGDQSKAVWPTFATFWHAPEYLAYMRDLLHDLRVWKYTPSMTDAEIQRFQAERLCRRGCWPT